MQALANCNAAQCLGHLKNKGRTLSLHNPCVTSSQSVPGHEIVRACCRPWPRAGRQGSPRL